MKLKKIKALKSYNLVEEQMKIYMSSGKFEDNNKKRKINIKRF